MGEGYNFKRLSDSILALSRASDWEAARKEWRLIDIWETDDPETCLCGHYPIKEICTILNQFTARSADVGNCCVKRFLGVRSDKIFSAVKKIKKDISKSLNDDSIDFFREQNVINDWEYNFLQSTMRKRVLSCKQLEKRKSINEKIIAATSKRGFSKLQ